MKTLGVKEKMFAFRTLLGLVLLAAVNARYVTLEDQRYPLFGTVLDEDRYPLYFGDETPDQDHEIESYQPEYFARVRRQAQGSMTLNSNGGTSLGAKIPIAGNDKNVLSALGSIDMKNNMQTASKGFGLALDNANGHGLSVIKETVPGFGSKLTGAGRLNVFHNDNHNVAANAFVTKNMPTNFPNVPNFNTVGGGVDYMYKNKVGASLGMANTPFLDRKDYSAMGNLNVFRSPTSSVDFSAGFKKFDTPVFKSNWEPNFGLTFSRSFGGF